MNKKEKSLMLWMGIFSGLVSGIIVSLHSRMIIKLGEINTGSEYFLTILTYGILILIITIFSYLFAKDVFLE